MNKFVTTALATAVAGSVGYADPGDSEWLELDSEITNLARNLRPAQDGLNMAMLFRGAFTYSGDDIATGAGPGMDDIVGFTFEDVDFALWGSEENYGYRVSMDLAQGAGQAFTLEDGYAYWTCGEYFTAKMGQFKPKVLHSGYIDPEQQLFIDRTALGAKFDFWNLGLGAVGTWEQIHWSASIHNGSDGDGSDQVIVARAELALGEAAGMDNLAAAAEGALGGSEEMSGIIGISYYYNESGPALDDVWGVFADFNGNAGPIGIAGEIGYLADDVLSTIGGGTSDWSNIDANATLPLGGFAFRGDSVPWSVTGSYLLTPEIEIGGRIESLDNSSGVIGAGDGNSIVSVVANWYQAERRAKWQAQWSYFEGDGEVADGSIFQIGLVVGGSR